MKKFVCLLACVILCMGVYAQKQKLTALMSWASFCADGKAPYVESYLSFDAWNMEFVKESDGMYRSTVEIVLQVLKNDSTVYVSKYELKSPAIKRDDSRAFNFMNVKRFALPNGNYTLQYSLKDKAVDGDPIVVKDEMWVDYNEKTPSLSTFQTMSRIEPTVDENVLSRNGFDMEPYIDEFYPAQMNVLQGYVEIYNIDKEIFGNDFMTVSYIEVKETGRKVGDYQQVQRHASAKVVPVVANMDLSRLPSGNYNFVFEVRNRENQLLLFKRVPFIRSNPSVSQDVLNDYETSFAAQINDENLLNYYLDALYPISSPAEREWVSNMIKRPGHLAEKQSFLYNFWVGRTDLFPEDAWREYRTRLDYVSANFSYPRTPGYLTDRGRVYLQYGAPDFVRDEKNFVSARNLVAQGQIFYLPYQLWRYNTLKGDEPNRVFLFWDEFRSGYYKLLNSNARGEVQDPKWERVLSQQQLSEDVMGEVGEQFQRGY